jgi:hypothetical protein
MDSVMAAEGDDDNTQEETEEREEDMYDEAQVEAEPSGDPEIDEEGGSCSEDDLDTIEGVDSSDVGENSDSDDDGGYTSY